MVSKETMVNHLKEFFDDDELKHLKKETTDKLIEMACWLYDYLAQEEE